MNMFKKNGGFTLVELIVVIAILAILAGVAVPMYSGYITKANEAADMTQLDAVKTAVFFAVAEKDATATVEAIYVNESNEIYVDVNTSTPGAAKGYEKLNISAYATVDLDTLDAGTSALWTAASAKWALDTPAANLPTIETETVPTT